MEGLKHEQTWLTNIQRGKKKKYLGKESSSSVNLDCLISFSKLSTVFLCQLFLDFLKSILANCLLAKKKGKKWKK